MTSVARDVQLRRQAAAGAALLDGILRTWPKIVPLDRLDMSVGFRETCGSPVCVMGWMAEHFGRSPTFVGGLQVIGLNIKESEDFGFFVFGGAPAEYEVLDDAWRTEIKRRLGG